jgi:2-iminobutanoate/2-iminopropanoate deaminase
MKLVGTDIESQTVQVLTNLKNIIEAAGSEMTKVVKTTILLTDIANFAAVNSIYASFFPENPPARATYAVLALPAGALIEIEAVAMV